MGKVLKFKEKEDENPYEDTKGCALWMMFRVDVYFDKSRKQIYIIGEPEISITHTSLFNQPEKESRIFKGKKYTINYFTDYQTVKDTILSLNPAFKEENCVLSCLGELVPDTSEEETVYTPHVILYQKINKYRYMREMGIPHKQNSI